MGEKKKLGQPPKYRAEFASRAHALCRFGAIDADLAEVFGVSEATINRWKKSHPEFKAALDAGKPFANELVERALFESAIGWSHRAVKIMAVSDGSGAGSRIEEVEYTERFPPNVTAQIFFLKNRDPERWRDKQINEIEVGRTLEDMLTRSWQIPTPAPTPALPAAADPNAEGASS